jgi:phage shock protein C
MVAGVCGGLADYFDIDPTLVRLAFVLLVFAGSAGFWLYVVMALVVPEEPAASYSAPEEDAFDEEEE